jgi:hypothetical protein
MRSEIVESDRYVLTRSISFVEEAGYEHEEFGFRDFVHLLLFILCFDS